MKSTYSLPFVYLPFLVAFFFMLNVNTAIAQKQIEQLQKDIEGIWTVEEMPYLNPDKKIAKNLPKNISDLHKGTVYTLTVDEIGVLTVSIILKDKNAFQGVALTTIDPNDKKSAILNITWGKSSDKKLLKKYGFNDVLKVTIPESSGKSFKTQISILESMKKMGNESILVTFNCVM